MNMPIYKTARRHPRRGFTLIEALAAAAVLMVVTGLVVKTVGWSVVERRAAARRLWAQQEAANIMERVTARPYAELTSDAAEDVELSAAAGRMLPDGQLDVSIEDATGALPARKINVSIHWRNPAGEHVSPVRLTAWVFDRGEQP